MGMGGPAMIEGGGLGQFPPHEIGPTPLLAKNGVIDLVAKDEADAVAKGKKYLSYFQGDKLQWQEHPQETLYNIIPDDRRYAYDIRKVIDVLADQNSVLELRKEFAKNMCTALIRIQGKPLGVMA